MIKKIPPPQILTYTDVSISASLGACIRTANGFAKNTITTKSTTAIIVNTVVAPPSSSPI